jgi:hypothetical protein
MALASNALTTLATVKDELGISDTSQDDRLGRLINVVSDAIEHYCGRLFQKTSRIEPVAPSGTLRLVLTHAPLTSITSIVDTDDSTVDATTYSIEDAAAGIVLGDSAWPAADLAIGIAQDPVPGTGKKLTVTYVGGYVLPNDGGTRTLPYDLEDACVRAVVTRYRMRGRDGTVASEAMGDASVSYFGTNTAIGRGVGGGELPDDVIPTLDRYRRFL